jgi:hypothetical protein
MDATFVFCLCFTCLPIHSQLGYGSSSCTCTNQLMYLRACWLVCTFQFTINGCTCVYNSLLSNEFFLKKRVQPETHQERQWKALPVKMHATHERATYQCKDRRWHQWRDFRRANQHISGKEGTQENSRERWRNVLLLQNDRHRTHLYESVCEDKLSFRSIGLISVHGTSAQLVSWRAA